LIDVNTKEGSPDIFNRVHINTKGIYYLEKLTDNSKASQIIVNHLQFKISGFDELKEKVSE
jgi:hypothetical protein